MGIVLLFPFRFIGSVALEGSVEYICSPRLWADTVFYFHQRIGTYKSKSFLIFSDLGNITVISPLCYFCSLDVMWTQNFAGESNCAE